MRPERSERDVASGVAEFGSAAALAQPAAAVDHPALVRRILARPARLGGTRLVAVDGPSGAGKTSFARRLASAFAAAGVAAPVVHTDDLLDGWGDQFTFWPRLREQVLEPLRAGRPGRYRRYDWARGAFGPDLVTVPPAPVVILEGVSSARDEATADLTFAVFVTAPSWLCRARVLARDGSAVAAHLLTWQRGERAHFHREATATRVDLLVDGAIGAPPAGRGGQTGAPSAG
jgi:uridine kinase